MARILAVFGATGAQGGSVIDHVLNDAHLSQQYSVRAITRDPDSEKANQLKARGVEVRQGDVSDRESLRSALTGVHTVFLMTTPSFGPDAIDAEFTAATNVADVSVETGVQLIIFSTLPAVAEISRGKYTKLTMFDAKAKAERYIRKLPIDSAFYSPGSFMENWITFAAPRREPEGSSSSTFVMAHHTPPSTKIPLIDAAEDTGKFIASILADPEKYRGKTLCGAERLYSLDEVASAIGKASNKDVVYKQISVDDFLQRVPFGAETIVALFSYIEEFGYYGGDTQGLVAAAADSARGKLTTLNEFLERRSPSLD
ncbi:hscarg dehydrogenase [Purpureocillium lavendulum]|uniref:Hscarg dehydrogenase n=1 Tax=Purpureocillium lavendulum TaxID=1247861 RepID=A0AB34FQU3_9HYPO|nr:hscarg dehydrogenase [Purpureocillium lavendulum]